MARITGIYAASKIVPLDFIEDKGMADLDLDEQSLTSLLRQDGLVMAEGIRNMGFASLRHYANADNTLTVEHQQNSTPVNRTPGERTRSHIVGFVVSGEEANVRSVIEGQKGVKRFFEEGRGYSMVNWDYL